MGGHKQPHPTDESLEPLFLLSDEPIGGDHDNHFKPDPFASTIARAALGSRGPFTIGVYGDWGSGKTSALHAAKDMIDKSPAWSHVVTVEFNAWRYEREEHPIVPLVATIEKAVAAKLKDRQSLTKQGKAFAVKSLTFIAQTLGAFMEASSFKAEGKAGVPFVTEGGVGVEFDGEKFVEGVKDAAKSATDSPATQWTKARDAAIYYSIFERLNALHIAASHMDGEALDKFPRVVVFIDDLDRCQAEKAFELLENVKLVLCQPGFVFVLALNEVVVRKYIDHLAEKRYGVNHVAIHKSYLDKIVQLPLHMPSRGERFKTFADAMIETRLDKAVDAGRKAELKKLAQVLALSANRTPRSLVRRINTVLIDIALRDETALRGKLVGEEAPYPNFAGLCIVQRTLETALTRERTRALAEDTDLCKVLHDRGIFGALRWLDEQRDQRGKLDDAGSKAAGTKEGARDDDIASVVAPLQNKQRKVILDAIYDEVFLYKEDNDHAGKPIAGTSLLTCPEGKRWLIWHEERRAVMQISIDRPQAQPAATALPDQSGPPQSPRSAKPSDSSSWLAAARRVAKEERHIIERKVRQHLKLPADANLGNADYARVKVLDFFADPITDEGLRWLAAKDSPLTALTKLILDGTQVTDRGLAALAAPSSPIIAIMYLDLGGTRVTDETLAALTAPISPFNALTKLFLDRTQITNRCLAILATPNSSLTALTTLNLVGTKLTDECFASLAAPNSPLTALSNLYLDRTQVTDAVLAYLAARSSAHASWKELSFTGTQVTDATAKVLQAPAGPFSRLKTVWLDRTRVTPAAIAALRKARPKLKVEY